MVALIPQKLSTTKHSYSFQSQDLLQKPSSWSAGFTSDMPSCCNEITVKKAKLNSFLRLTFERECLRHCWFLKQDIKTSMVASKKLLHHTLTCEVTLFCIAQRVTLTWKTWFERTSRDHQSPSDALSLSFNLISRGVFSHAHCATWSVHTRFLSTSSKSKFHSIRATISCISAYARLCIPHQPLKLSQES